MERLNGRTALVTGASRGIGATVAYRLAQQWADVVINYRSKGPRAEQVAGTIQALGRHALLAQADLTDDAALQAMFDATRTEFGQLDVLILNASGGMEKGSADGYALRLNRDAQLRAAELALPLMPRGGRIVFVTSHLAHFHEQMSSSDYPGYEPIAASKKAGEEALRARIPELTAQGVSLVVVSGDLIEGTITPKLMERASPGLIEARRREAGSLPTVEEFAEAIVQAAGDPSLETGATVYVGSTDGI